MIKARLQGGLISFEIDEATMEMINIGLGDLRSQSGKVLKKAVNATAKQARTELAKKAKEAYVVKQSRFTKAMTIKKATDAAPSAIIHVTGEQLELRDFKVSPAKYQAYGKDKAPPEAYKAKVIKANTMKKLVHGENKAFLARFRNGRVALVQRRTKKRFPLKKLMSNSIPIMIGNENNVYGVLEPKIHDLLMENIHKEIDRVVNSA